MKKFIYTVIAFSILNVLLYTSIRFIVSPETTISNDYMLAMQDKHDRVDQINSPKIIFAGGSNLAFGLNSEEVEKEFSVPVVNLGLHAGLGLNFILSELKSTIKKEDVVFLSIEYLMDSDGDYKLKKNTGSNYKEALNYYTFDFRAEILIDIDKTRENIMSYNNENVVPELKSENLIYSREAFNKYGDVVAHLEEESLLELNDRNLLIYKYWTGIDALNEFYKYAKSKNVEVFFTYPNYSSSEYDKNQKVINKLSKDLSNNLKIEIVNKPSDFVFPDSLFFDTVYHLNKKGREARTNKLIDLIKKNKNAHQRIKGIAKKVLN